MPIQRAVGQALLKSLVKFDLPGSQMISILRSAGAAYRYQDMLSDIREYTGRRMWEGNISKMTGNSVIPDAWMNRVSMNYPYKYKVWADVTYYDFVSDQYITDKRSLYTDDLMKIEDYQGFVEGSEIASAYYSTRDVFEVTITGLDVNTRVR